MSIVSDIRSYADNAVAEGRKALDSTLSTAQAQLNDVSGQANDIVGKASEAAAELRTSAEKAINVDAIKSAIEPYLEQAKGYQASVQERAEAIFAELKKDPRLAKAFEVSEVVVETVSERVVKPVISLTGLGGGAKPAPKATSKPSPTKSAARKPATTKPASKPAAKKTAARKAPAKRATGTATKA